MSVKKLSCWGCGKEISGPRTVIEGKWHCADCTYIHDHPDQSIPVIKRTRAAKQKETLFPLPDPLPRAERKGAHRGNR